MRNRLEPKPQPRAAGNFRKADGEAGDVVKALSQGIGAKGKTALETTIALSPKHADAHIALGAFHAEVIDKVGGPLGRTQAASRDAGLKMFK